MNPGRFFADGRELSIGKRIGRGGEGDVYLVNDMPGFALKVYKPDKRSERAAKVRAMVRMRLAHNASTIAFPYQVAVDRAGAFAGFLMRLVEKHKEIHELQTPSSRLKYFQKADYAFIVRVALNVARVFAQAHAAGCVVGDINQRGVLVAESATVALIDADSFQINDGSNQYLCVVGVPEYTPPELQGRSLDAVVRTQDHDAFGLAVCLFQLLCMDRHPFAGRYSGQGDMPLEKAIAEYRFPYSLRKTGLTPPPGAVILSDFPSRIGQLFESAFSPDHLGRRPSPTVWVDALIELEASLRPCSYRRIHRYSRAAKECPWCRMEAVYGRPLFIDTEIVKVHLPAGRIDPSSGYVLDLNALMAAISGVRLPAEVSVALPQPQGTLSPSPAAIAAASKKRFEPLTKFSLLGGALALAIASRAAGMPWLLSIGIIGAGIWMLMKVRPATDALFAEFQLHSRAASARMQQLQAAAPIEALIRKKAQALDAIGEYRQLAAAYADVRSEYDRSRQQKQLDDHLSRATIRDARIPKLSSADIAQLASYGFDSALDAKQRDVLQVHGIGPVKSASIRDWIKRLEAHFKFHSSYTTEDQRNIQKLQNDIITRQQGLEDRIATAIEAFRQEARAFERWKEARDPELFAHAQRLFQSEVDLQHLGISAPPRPSVAPQPVPSISRFLRTPIPAPTHAAFAGRGSGATAASGRANAVLCPMCNGPMVRRTARRGARAGRPFWGCSRYPSCRGTRPI